MRASTAIKIVQRAGAGWIKHDGATLGAALAYYAVFSVAPLLMIAIAISGLVFGEAAARGQIVDKIADLVGRQGAAAIESLIEHAGTKGAGATATLIGMVVLFFGASGVFGQLQNSLNKIWGVALKPGLGIASWIRRRLLSFAMTLCVGFLLLISLVLTAWLAALGKFMNGILPQTTPIGQLQNFIVSFGVITLLFALIFRVLPDARIRWRDVTAGAGFTALLFSAGKELIGLYLGTSAVASGYGAAGSLVVLLLWIYYSSQILFFGAEITKAYATIAGSYSAPSSEVQPALGAESTKNRG